jgi:hypothetical protein
MMRLFLLLPWLLPLGATAQDLSRYLEGAVPVRDGRVVFSREVEAPGLSAGEVFARVEGLAGGRFGGEGMVLYANEEEGTVVCQGREYIEFKRSTLVLDRALIEFQALYICRAGGCTLEVARVRYFYGEEKRTRYLAEEWITDEFAYDGKRNRLLRGSDKFRVKTIDLVDGLEEGLRGALSGGGRPAERLATMPAGTTGRDGYLRVLPTEVNGNFIGMLAGGVLEVPGARVHARWGGMGFWLDRPVVFCFAGEGEDLGTEFSLVWRPGKEGQGLYREVVFECRLLAVQPLAAGVRAGEAEGEALSCLHVGEVVTVWVK